MAALGNLALDFDLLSGEVADRLLFLAAYRAWRAPSGSALELRGALVLVGLGSDLREATLEAAASCGYEMAPTACAVARLITARGGDHEAAPAAVLAAQRALRAPAPAPAAVPVCRVLIPDPHPGLKIRGESWDVFATRAAGRQDVATDNARAEWRAAGEAMEAGRIEAWIAEVGSRIGATWEPPTEG